MNEQYKTGDRVKIDTDYWDDVGVGATVIEVQGHKCIVEDDRGVTRTLSLNEIQPLRFLSE